MAIVKGLIVLELIFLVFLLVQFPTTVFAGVGSPNATVTTTLQVGNSFPEFVSITINDDDSIDLTPNATQTVTVSAVIRDYNGEDDIQAVTSEFFDNTASFFGDSDDNNYHYTNTTCSIDTSYGDGSEVQANCTFPLQYYANNATWNASITVNDSLGSTSFDSATQIVSTLLSFILPDTIDYGEVNSTLVSEEVLVNVTNAGNVMVNLSLSGYGATVGDGLAMNCSLGSVQNISVEHQKYNLNYSVPDTPATLQDFGLNYTNLSSSVVVNPFNLGQRQNDTTQYVDETNQTYWRIYVPTGVAGNCTGNIVFGAIQSPASG